LSRLDEDEKIMIKMDSKGDKKVDKNRQDVQYYFLKVLQDNVRIRKLSCKYQKAMYEGAKEISDFEKIPMSEIGSKEDLAGGGEDFLDGLEDLGF